MINPLKYYKEQIIKDKTYIWIISIILFKNFIFLILLANKISYYAIFIFVLSSILDLIIGFTLIPLALYIFNLIETGLKYLFGIVLALCKKTIKLK